MDFLRNYQLREITLQDNKRLLYNKNYCNPQPKAIVILLSTYPQNVKKCRKQSYLSEGDCHEEIYIAGVLCDSRIFSDY